MPAYQFKCDRCGRVEEVVRPIRKGPPRRVECPGCGDEMWHCMGCEFVLKGDGWAGVEAKNGDRYRERWIERDADERGAHERSVSESEADEVMAARRRGKKAFKEYSAHEKAKVDRYRKNLKKGVGRNAGKRKG